MSRKKLLLTRADLMKLNMKPRVISQSPSPPLITILLSIVNEELLQPNDKDRISILVIFQPQSIFIYHTYGRFAP